MDPRCPLDNVDHRIIYPVTKSCKTPGRESGVSPKVYSQVVPTPYNLKSKNTVDECFSKWMPRVLVIGPGGTKGLKALGFLSPIEDHGLLQYTDTYCGVSVGAIISLLIVAGYQIREIVGEVANLDLFKDMEILTVRSMLDNRGFLSNEPVRKRLVQLLLNRFGVVPTLHGLYMQTGKAFIAVTLNATDEKCEMMGPFTHPNVSCVDATMFSMNIPFVFYQLVYQGKTYVDGALANPYPVDYFDDGDTNILGIYMKTSHDKSPILSPNTTSLQPNSHTNHILHRLEPPSNSPIPLGSYCFKIVHSLMDQRRNHIVQKSSSRCKHVCLESKSLDVVGYSITKEEKARMLVEGFNEGKEFITLLTSNLPIDPKVPPPQLYHYPPYYISGFKQNSSEEDPPEDHTNSLEILSAMTS